MSYGELHGKPPYTFDHFTAHVREWQEERRHECEVRYLLQLQREQGRAAVVDFLNCKPVAARRARLVKDLNAALAAKRRGAIHRAQKGKA